MGWHADVPWTDTVCPSCKGLFVTIRRLPAALVALTCALVPAIALAPTAGATETTPLPVTSTVPAAPVISSVTAGKDSGTLVVAYGIPDSGGSPITSYQASVDGGVNWPTCTDLPGTCTLINLTNGQAYSVQIRAVNGNGASASSAAVTGTPVAPAGPDPDRPAKLPSPHVFVKASFDPAGNGLGSSIAPGTPLGAGTLPTLKFSRTIPNKAAVEKHLVVKATTNTGQSYVVPGSWGWLDGHTVMFRPKSWWPGYSTITIESRLGRTVLGKSGSTSIVGAKGLDTEYSFRTGHRLIARVDGKTDRMKVFVDGVKRKDFPVSLGQKEWETSQGVKVISTRKEPKHTYTSASLQLTTAEDTANPAFYELKDIPWNTRLTPSGEFIHSAPWASGRIGKWNGSHGCTNMFTNDAKWMYDKTIPGDVVIYTNTGGQTVAVNNGPGGLWNIPWAAWLKKSALTTVTGSVDTSADVNGPVAAGASA